MKVEFESDLGEKVVENKEAVMFITLLAVIAVVYAFTTDTTTGSAGECPIMYSPSQCINGDIVTAFHNPNEEEITDIEITIPKDNGQDILMVEEPLGPDQTETLTKTSCETHDKNSMEIKWCCGSDCFEQVMAYPDTSFNITELE